MGKYFGGLKFCSSLRKVCEMESSCTCLIRPFVLTEVAYGQGREVVNGILDAKIISLACIHSKQCHKIHPWTYF